MSIPGIDRRSRAFRDAGQANPRCRKAVLWVAFKRPLIPLEFPVAPRAITQQNVLA